MIIIDNHRICIFRILFKTIFGSLLFDFDVFPISIEELLFGVVFVSLDIVERVDDIWFGVDGPDFIDFGGHSFGEQLRFELGYLSMHMNHLYYYIIR